MKTNGKSTTRSILACATAIWLACALVAVEAQAGDQARSETVRFADLNLDTQAGVAALYGRIHAAARRVCSYEPTSVSASSAWQNCVRPAVDAAVAKVNNPRLTALHTGRNPSPATAMINK